MTCSEDNSQSSINIHLWSHKTKIGPEFWIKMMYELHLFRARKRAK
jgi:hypothetical protein